MRRTKPPSEPAEAACGGSSKYLSFQLGDQEYVIEVLRVREIVKIQGIMAVPERPPDVRRVMNLRGRVIPVLDLRMKFGTAGTNPGQRMCIIVVEPNAAAHGPTGIIVDAVNQVLTLSETDIQDTPAFGRSAETPFLPGVTRVRDESRILLDIDQLLTADLSALRQPLG